MQKIWRNLTYLVFTCEKHRNKRNEEERKKGFSNLKRCDDCDAWFRFYVWTFAVYDICFSLWRLCIATSIFIDWLDFNNWHYMKLFMHEVEKINMWVNSIDGLVWNIDLKKNDKRNKTHTFIISNCIVFGTYIDNLYLFKFIVNGLEHTQRIKIRKKKFHPPRSWSAQIHTYKSPHRHTRCAHKFGSFTNQKCNRIEQL